LQIESYGTLGINVPRISWDRSKPDGQPRRCLDTSKARKEFGFEAKTKLIDGLRKTIDWYVKNRENGELGARVRDFDSSLT